MSIAPGITTPRYFSDSRSEHLATRASAGLFDFSFMGCAEISGPASLTFLHTLQTRALCALQPGRIAYTLLLREDGTVLIDATVWCVARDLYRLFVGRRGDVELVAGWAGGFDVCVTDISGRHAVIAVQGAASGCVIERCFSTPPLCAFPYYVFGAVSLAGAECLLARIGYSGETGYELVTADAAGPGLWQALLAAGADEGLTECGFDATDSLRIEAGHLLFTHELTAAVTPFELGLDRMVDLYGRPFRGAASLRARRWQTAGRRLVGLLLPTDAAPHRNPSSHVAPGHGVLTSSCWSPIFERWLGLGYVDGADRYPGTRVTLGCGTRAVVSRLPFYDPVKYLPRNTR